MPRVFDVFPFFNELDLLELRMRELSPVVDVFGAVECPLTFRGEPKPMYLAGRSDLRVHRPEACPQGPHPTVDWFQRGQTAKLLWDAQPDDVVMLSDVDEIPNREVVRRLVEAGVDEPLTLMMDLYYHRVDLRDPIPWDGTVIIPRRLLGDEPDMEKLREARSSFAKIPSGGWHFSWMGPPDRIRTKLRAVDIIRDDAIFGNNGMTQPKETEEFLRDCYEGRRELFGRNTRRKYEVPIVPGVNQPHEIVPWLARHPEYARSAE